MTFKYTWHIKRLPLCIKLHKASTSTAIRIYTQSFEPRTWQIIAMLNTKYLGFYFDTYLLDQIATYMNTKAVNTNACVYNKIYNIIDSTMRILRDKDWIWELYRIMPIQSKDLSCENEQLCFQPFSFCSCNTANVWLVEDSPTKRSSRKGIVFTILYHICTVRIGPTPATQ